MKLKLFSEEQEEEEILLFMPLRNLFFLHFIVTFTPTGLKKYTHMHKQYLHASICMERCQSEGGCSLTRRPSSSSAIHTDWSVLVPTATTTTHFFPTRTLNTAAVTLLSPQHLQPALRLQVRPSAPPAQASLLCVLAFYQGLSSHA